MRRDYALLDIIPVFPGLGEEIIIIIIIIIIVKTMLKYVKLQSVYRENK